MLAVILAALIGLPESAVRGGNDAERVGAASPTADRPIDFVRDIRPILEARCVRCHGPQREKSGLRLDSKAAALKGGDLYDKLFVPGQGAESTLVLITTTGIDGVRMPPKDAGPALTLAETTLLRRWIDQGAAWPDIPAAAAAPSREHWSFQPVVRPAVPPVADSNVVVRNPIDAFIVATLAEHGLQPAPEADRRTLIRRLYFDLVGLPPAPEEIAAFVASENPAAYTELVEKLLGSPQYGERWARHWLDVVRFAESDGFETNLARANAWPYRDYVIQALNDDTPYDQFIRDQLAGDASGRDAATGFLVGGPYDRVKSPDALLTAQQRDDELHDMVSTTAATFLGLTLGCARCHNHKFDPISQVDYYAMTAIFSGVRHGERPIRPADYEDRMQRAAALQVELAAVEASLARFVPLAQPARVIVLDDLPAPKGPGPSSVTQVSEAPPQGPIDYSPGSEPGQLSDPGDTARLPNLGASYRYWLAEAHPPGGPVQDFFTWNPNLAGRFAVWLSWAVWPTHAPDARYVFDRDGDLATRDDQQELAVVDQSRFSDGRPAIADQRRWSGLRFAGVVPFGPASHIVLRGGSRGGPTTADLVLLEELTDDQVVAPTATLPRLRGPATHRTNVERFAPVEVRYVRFTVRATTDIEPCIDELEVFTAGPEPRNVALAAAGAKSTASSTLPGHTIHQLAHIHDGRYGNSFSWISNERGGGWVQLEFARPELIDRILWSRDRSIQGAAFEDRVATQYVVEVSTDGVQWRAVAGSHDRLPPEYRRRIAALPTITGFDSAQRAEAQELVERKAKLQAAIQELTTYPVVYAGQFSQPGPTYRLHRGAALQFREPVAPGAIAQLGPPLQLAADAPERERRSALAHWIADPQHPLTARVAVNRIWHYHFGTGLVDTPSDFGRNGGRPSHPELLDWLAAEFVAPQSIGPHDPAPPWSIKHMQRLIVNSATYRQASARNERAAAVDAGARWLWRFPPRRLEAEPLRDTILAVSGNLNPRAGGPGFDLFESNANYVKVYTSKTVFGPEESRRMIYQAKPRVQLDDVFGAFDCPDAGQIAPRRTSSTTPLQAANLLNSPYMLAQAEIFANRLRREAGADPAAQAARAFGLAFGRAPAPDEAAAAARLITERGLPLFCRAIFNANEFLFVD